MKMCRFYPDKRCYHASCSLIDEFGNVSVCSVHPNPNGLAMRCSVSRSHVSIFELLRGRDKHG
jgi:hypothetical protein